MQFHTAKDPVFAAHLAARFAAAQPIAPTARPVPAPGRTVLAEVVGVTFMLCVFMAAAILVT